MSWWLIVTAAISAVVVLALVVSVAPRTRGRHGGTEAPRLAPVMIGESPGTQAWAWEAHEVDSIWRDNHAGDRSSDQAG